MLKPVPTVTGYSPFIVECKPQTMPALARRVAADCTPPPADPEMITPSLWFTLFVNSLLYDFKLSKEIFQFLYSA